MVSNKRESRPSASDSQALEGCLAELQRHGGKTGFAAVIARVEEQIRRFRQKQSAVQTLLQQKFNPVELSYIRFWGAVCGLEKVMLLNVRSLLDRMAAFDEAEFIRLSRSGPVGGAAAERLKIFREHIAFGQEAVEDHEQILLKLDRLLAELSRLGALDEGQLETMEAMQSIDALIRNAKWYR